ncbi:MAG: FAD-dependent oxidoreductase [Sulfitobacter sp.]
MIIDPAQHPIIIIGAGPVGLTLAWKLASAGIPVQVFEAEPNISDQLRASTFHPPTLDFFQASGITDELIAKGRITPTWQIRLHETGERAEFDLSVLSEDTQHPYRLQCRQEELSRALLARLPAGTVHFGQEVSAVGQEPDHAWVDINGTRIQGSLVIGCEGARSLTRKAIGAEFEGETYPENTILVTTHFPFHEVLDGLTGVNYIWKPGGTYSLLRLPDLWRISLHLKTGQTAQEALEDSAIRAQTREVIPEAGDLDIVEKRIYRVHRRVATRYRNKRLFIAGDAAHLNSPKGGMGMNGGVHDAFNLADAVTEVLNGADSDRLNRYERQRRPIACDEIVAQADANRTRMNTQDPAARLAYLKELQELANDPEKARTFLRRSSMITGLWRAEAIE